MTNSTIRYDWKRFWCPREGSIALEREGFLLDPDELRSEYLRTDAVPFESIKAVPCLLLLGEPGIGKTNAMEVASNEVKAALPLGEEHLHIDCRIHRRLEKLLFDNPKFIGWRDGRQILHLFIDSLDEHPDPGAAPEILGELSQGPIDNLRLRIACRTAQIPPILEPELHKLWGKDAEGKDRFAVYELTPLRKKDVELAVNAEGLNAEKFLSAVANRGATALAIKPVTLKFLLNMFRGNQDLPKTRWEIYEEGCRKLCDENSASRKTNRDRGKLNWSQRMAIAGRIAAACILGNQATVYLDPDPGDLATDTLLAEVLVGKQERAQEKDFDVDEAAVQETLTMTGLFNERGRSQLLGWAHQTYAEFLTARFLHERGLRLGDLSGILFPATERLQIVPGLREVAAWLASTDIVMFRQLIDQDPRTLLQSDVAMVDDVERKKLVDALLDGFANGRMIDDSMGGRRVYRKLGHSGLTEQLEPWIRGKDKDWMARRAAINIAEACSIQTLQQALADVALDLTDSVNTRVQAAQAVVEIGDAQTLLRLRPLAHGQAGDDPNDELRGWALRALWPKYMSAQEMFQCLSRLRNTGYYGHYRSFIGQLETDYEFTDRDLVHALHWVGEQPAAHNPLEDFGALSEQIVRKAWERIDNLQVLTAIVKLAEIRYHRHESLFENSHQHKTSDSISVEDDIRRKSFLPLFAQSTQSMDLEYWGLHDDKLVMPQDIPWMIEQLDACSSQPVRMRWAIWIEQALCHKGFILESMEAILDAWPRHAELRKALQWLEPIEIGSPLAAELRKHHEKDQERLAKRASRRADQQERVLDPSPAERVLRSLDRYEKGNIYAFWQMLAEMWLRPKSTRDEDRGAPDLSKSPGWLEADDSTRVRILAAARRYILEAAPKTSRWLGKNLFPLPSMAGYRAFYLLFSHDPKWVEQLETTFWQRWAPAILGYPSGLRDQDTSSRHRQLVVFAYHNAPGETLSALNVLIDSNNRQHNEIFIIRELENCWDMQLGAFFLEKAKDPSLKPSVLGFLLDDLLQRNVAGVREYAASLIDFRLLQKKNSRRRACAAAEALFRQPTDAGWPILQPIFLADPPFGYKVVLEACTRIDVHRNRESRWSSLSEEELKSFFLWMAEQFPREEDTEESSGGLQAITPRDTAAEVRDAVLTALSRRGTTAAVDAIRHIEQILGGDDSLRFIRIHAEEEMLARSFQPLTPAKVIDLRPRAIAQASTKETETMTKMNPLVERCDVLIMTATEIETGAALAAAKSVSGREAKQIHGARTYHDLGEYGGAKMLLVSTVQAGSDTPGGSMSTAFSAIAEVEPKAIIMVGIAFGVDPEKQPIGRVLYSQQLQCYGPTRIGTDKQTGARIDIPRGDKVTPMPPWVLHRFNNAKLSWAEGGSEGSEGCIMLSGPSLVDHVDYRDSLHELFPEAKGGEMEGAGLYGAAAEKGIPWIIVKAICDYADGNKHENKAERQKLAAERAASFVFHAIAQGGFAPRG